jgi:hypothetical protein
MTESGQMFQVKQTVNVNGRARTVEFTVDRGKTASDGVQHMVLTITEDNKRVLSILVDRETVANPNDGASYKFVVDINRNTSEVETKLTAEIVTRKGRDFWWFGTPEDELVAYVRERSIESLVNEFVRDLLTFLSGSVTVKARQE